MQSPQIILSKDGSHSLYQQEYDTTFHSMHGAITESNHIFIQAGLDCYLREHPQAPLHILELGFGTGLNALLTFLSCFERNVQLKYTALELFPVATEVTSQLNYPQMLSQPLAEEVFEKMHNAKWNAQVEILPDIILTKHNVDWMDYQPESFYQLVYLDFFGPQSQPDLWNLISLQKISQHLESGGMITTFCAQGEFKRNLKKLDFTVESLAGPVGKREMVRARKK